MRQSCAAVFWLFILASGVCAQTLSGSVSVSTIGGYQSNPYLDPTLNEWESSFPRTFMALVPTGGLVWSTGNSYVGAHVMGRMDAHPGETVPSTLKRMIGYGSYELAPRWELGGQGGWRQYRYGEVTNSWWALPSVRWKPSSSSGVDLKIGWTERTTRDSLGYGETYSSGLGVLGGHVWVSDRLRLRLDLYLSDSRAATGNMTFGGSGITSSATYWIANRLSLSLSTGVEYLQYEMDQSQSENTSRLPDSNDSVAWQNLLWKTGAEVRWQIMQEVTVFSRARVMQAHQSFASDPRYDGHLSVGATVAFDRRLIRMTETGSSASLWQKTDDGMRLEVTYSGEGQLYITGDFNNWAAPGQPLRRIGEDRYSVTLRVPPGRYEYSIRVIGNGSEHWLDLPDGLQTVNDGFGNENGVLVVN